MSLSVTGCRCGTAANRFAELERSIEGELAKSAITVVAHCSPGVVAAGPPACTVTAPDRSTVVLVMGEAGDDWHWALPARTIDSHSVAALAVRGFSELAPTAPLAIVDCGPRLQVLEPSQRLDCSVSDGRWVIATLGNEAGAPEANDVVTGPKNGANERTLGAGPAFRLELLSDPAAIVARRVGRLDAELTAASLALDGTLDLGEDQEIPDTATLDANPAVRLIDAKPTLSP
ncbi:MAG: hypothetical protein KBG15_12935 [Kofleriaceae bacterium]|nr:hypothetical protein [Kofleriaceae bacterium]